MHILNTRASFNLRFAQFPTYDAHDNMNAGSEAVVRIANW